ncbi:hypothetical protein [Microbacterium pumilum]|uniref:Uncharacterized protein n=1 Tax=Microbacterium pumilum TaxID=344165 RepID=A0ABN2T3Q2_9MICO
MTSDAPGRPWTPTDLAQQARPPELEIAAPRASGEPGRWTPIGVVAVKGALPTSKSERAGGSGR